MKCENVKKGENKILSIHKPTGCIKSFENTTICFNTDSKFSQFYSDQLNSLIKSL